MGGGSTGAVLGSMNRNEQKAKSKIGSGILCYKIATFLQIYYNGTNDFSIYS